MKRRDFLGLTLSLVTLAALPAQAAREPQRVDAYLALMWGTDEACRVPAVWRDGRLVGSFTADRITRITHVAVLDDAGQLVSTFDWSCTLCADDSLHVAVELRDATGRIARPTSRV